MLFPDVTVPVIATAEAKRTARRILFSSAPDAALVLYNAVTGKDVESVQVRAALAILDRTGFGAQSTIMVDDVTVDYDTMTDDQLRERASRVLVLLQARRGERSNTTADERTNDETAPATKPPQVH